MSESVASAEQRLADQLGRLAHCQRLLIAAENDVRWAREAVARARKALRNAKRRAKKPTRRSP